MSGVSLLIFKSSKVTKLVNAGGGGLVEFASILKGLDNQFQTQNEVKPREKMMSLLSLCI